MYLKFLFRMVKPKCAHATFWRENLPKRNGKRIPVKSLCRRRRIAADIPHILRVRNPLLVHALLRIPDDLQTRIIAGHALQRNR
jgi:hypothetical protein